jgi:hypothetical protein
MSRRVMLAGVAAIAGLALTAEELLRPGAAFANGAWGGYANGQLPLTTPPMTQVVAGQWLRTDAAVACQALMAAYQSHFGSALHINQAYRALGTPQDPASLQPETQWSAYYLAQQGGNLAATPGTSNHGWGLAVDFGGAIYTRTDPYFSWMQNNAGQYGWWWAGATFSQVENWHWEYSGIYTGTINPSIQETDEMYIVESSGRGQWLVGTNYKHHLNLEESAQVMPVYQSRNLVVDFGTNDRAFDVFTAAHTQATTS